jgi:hypothetical protein
MSSQSDFDLRISRRRFSQVTAAASVAGLGLSLPTCSFASDAEPRRRRVFRLWAMGDPHVHTDLYTRRGGKRTRRVDARESLGDAIRQSESKSGFDWDVAVCVGDFSGDQGVPNRQEGMEVVRQFAAAKQHRREQFYCLAGNHDASPDNRWFRRWVDPTGEHTRFSGVDAANRPHKIEGTWERYAFRVGNLLFLMMSDRNDYEPPVGRILNGKGFGGRPPGAVTVETFEWWKKAVAENPEAIVISAHHHMLKETTFASGEYEGFSPVTATNSWKSHYHGFFKDDGKHNKGASYLYWLVDESGKQIDATPNAQAFEQYLATHPGSIDLWLGGHTHSHPDDRKGGRSHVESKWGATFVNCCALSKCHARLTTLPMSRLFTFTEGSRQVRIQCYLHTSQHAPQGWYDKAERTITLSRPFVPPNS